jgi:uncharacterized protein with HEPN domain
LQNAVMRMVQIIGEAAARISPEVRNAHSQVPWRQILGMRNRLVHDYFRIDIAVVWEVVERDIPELILQIAPLVEPEGQEV